MNRGKKIAGRARAAATPGKSVKGMLEDIVGCKWSLTVLDLIRHGVCRPGAMEHAVAGLSAKVLNERLRKLMRFGIIEKKIFAETPPRVEYHLTAFGKSFDAVLDHIELLERSLAARRDSPAGDVFYPMTHTARVAQMG